MNGRKREIFVLAGLILQICNMKGLLNWFARLNQKRKIASSDPQSFEEGWSFQASRLQLISFFILVVLISGVLTSLFFLKGPFRSLFLEDEDELRANMVTQLEKLEDLEQQISVEHKYQENLKLILSGGTPRDTSIAKVKMLDHVDPSAISTEYSEAELELAQDIKNGMRTGKKKKSMDLNLFRTPLIGIISRGYSDNHLGLDIVAKEGEVIMACQEGTVIYSGFSTSEGYTLIIAHPNQFISVYKHNKVNFKKSGDKVHSADAIALVGNTGENSSGPHLHFELWKANVHLDPRQYIFFEN